MVLPARGSFVDCLFPFAEKPTIPAPMRHIVYLQAVLRLKTAETRALVMLSTTSPNMIARIPDGFSVSISRDISIALGMRNGFTIDVHRLALLPLTEEWFPDVGTPRFIIAQADEKLRNAVTRRYDAMLKMNPRPMMLLGPSMG